MNLSERALRVAVRALQAGAPPAAVWLAERLFFTPPRRPTSSDMLALLESGGRRGHGRAIRLDCGACLRDLLFRLGLHPLLRRIGPIQGPAVRHEIAEGEGPRVLLAVAVDLGHDVGRHRPAPVII